MDYIEHLIRIKYLLKEVERHVNEREITEALSKSIELSIEARAMKTKLHEQAEHGVI